MLKSLLVKSTLAGIMLAYCSAADAYTRRTYPNAPNGTACYRNCHVKNNIEYCGPRFCPGWGRSGSSNPAKARPGTPAPR
jgi:hypothetical protein